MTKPLEEPEFAADVSQLLVAVMLGDATDAQIGRLNELLRAFQAEHPQAFGQVFGDGNTALAQGLIDHTAKPRGGTDDLGKTVDSKFDLIADPWISRFHQAGLSRDLQRVQVNTALRAFRNSAKGGLSSVCVNAAPRRPRAAVEPAHCRRTYGVSGVVRVVRFRGAAGFGRPASSSARFLSSNTASAKPSAMFHASGTSSRQAITPISTWPMFESTVRLSPAPSSSGPNG